MTNIFGGIRTSKDINDRMEIPGGDGFMKELEKVPKLDLEWK